MILIALFAAQLLAKLPDTEMELDFKSCTPATQVTAFGLGSFTAQVVGKSRHGCVILFGQEIENPRWNGFLSSLCVVPENLGTQKYRVTNTGVDMSRLAPYCVRTPAPGSNHRP